MYNGQAEQDKYILMVLKNKKNGVYLEIGSNHPKTINNTYILEKNYSWTGIMVEYDDRFLNDYKTERPNSIHVINDARNIDYLALLRENNIPNNIDYLQIDLEANNGSTIETLEKLDRTILGEYKFATVTFEHDIYHTNYKNTRAVSREIFERRGYLCVFKDIHNIDPNSVYEDWYVHPDLVDMEYINRIIESNRERYVSNNITGKSINWQDIIYE
jgi:hypothetical protein